MNYSLKDVKVYGVGGAVVRLNKVKSVVLKSGDNQKLDLSDKELAVFNNHSQVKRLIRQGRLYIKDHALIGEFGVYLKQSGRASELTIEQLREKVAKSMAEAEEAMAAIDAKIKAETQPSTESAPVVAEPEQNLEIEDEAKRRGRPPKSAE